MKTEFTKIMLRSILGNYIDYDKVDEAKTQARMNVSIDNGNNSDDNY